MAKKTEIPKVSQHLLSDDESRKWKVVDIAVVSPTSVTALLQNNQEWCIDTFDYDENEYQRFKRICLQTTLKEPPLLLSYVHVENKLKHFVCTKKKLHLIDDESESIEKSLPLSAEPSALCVEDNKVYISTNETKTLMFFKLELPTDTSKIYLTDIYKHDSIAEFVVHSKNIYVRTKGGKVSSHKETGGKQHDYRNRKSKNSKARGLAVFTPEAKECNLLLVSWNDNKLIIFSTKTSHDLLDIELNVPGKIRFTTSCFLMSSEVNDVTVYNTKTVADRAAFKMILVSGSSDRDLSYLYDALLHDTTKEEASPPTILIKGKSLRTLVEMFDNSCTTNDNITAEKKKTETESDELRIMKEEKEKKCGSLTKQLEAERKATEEGGITKDTVAVSTENVKTDLRGLIDGILDDLTMELTKQKNDVTEELEITKSTLTKKEEDRSQIQVELDAAISNKMDLEKTVTKSEEQYRIIQAKEREIQQLRMRLKKAQTEVENAKTQVTILRDRKQELEKSLSREQERSKELEKLFLNLNERIKELESTKKKMESQVKKLKDNLVQEKQKVSREEKSRVQVETNLKKVEEMNTKLEGEVTELKERLLVEEKTTKEIQTSSLKLNERIKDLEDMKTELESQQKKLKDTLDQEKNKVTRAELSRIQVVTNLKKVEEMNTELEGEVTELKERLLVEEKTTKEMQTSSLKSEDLEGMKTELESQQKKLKDTLDQEKNKVTRAELSRIQAENDRKTLEQTKAMLEKEKEYLTKLLAAEERNETEMKKSLAKATTSCEKLQKAFEILQKEKEDLSEQLSTEKSNSEIQIASFSKMTSHALSGSEKTAQTKDEDSYLCDETQSVITESTDSERGSMHSGLEYQESFILNGRQLYTELKVAVTVASKGANMHIPDTGVELDIPTGATQGKVLIEMIILPFDKLDAPVSTFSCNSSVAVELLPNKMEFQRPVRLTLPHCLKLTKNYQKTKHQVQVYVSHHETGPPIWEEVPNAKYVLDETNCIIFLKSFCWVKYEVNNKIVEAKRIRVYTAGKRLKHTEDSLAETEVGYHWDLPIARENLSVNDNMFVYQSKPFIYLKEGNLPLKIFLTKTVPMQWKYITPKENPKVISFNCVADSKEKSCPFVIEKSEPTDRIPFCMFKVQQGNEDLELYIRFDD